MNDSNLLPLLEKYIEGTLDDAGRAELEKQILSSVEARRIFWEYLEQHAFIGELSGEAKGRALARLEKPPTRRTAAVRLPASKPTNQMPLLLAAGLLIGFVVILFASMSGSDVDEARNFAAFKAKQLERRKAAESRLREIEQERQKLLSRPVAPEGKPEPAKEEERKKALEALAERKRKVDEELRQVVEQEKPSVIIVEKKPEEPRPLPVPVPEKITTVAAAPPVARVLRAESAGSLQAGQDLAAGQGFETGAAGLVEISYADQTRVTFGPSTLVRDLKAEGGKRFALDRGEMRAVVAKQPKGQPMVVETPTSEATVVGTTLRLKIDAGTRLDVEEGVVSLKNKLNGKSVMVESGHYAVVAAGTELKSTALPIDEILVNFASAKITGGEWRLTKEGLESVAIYRPFVDPGQIPSYVTLTFEADANRDYNLWVRGICLGTGERELQDGILMKFARALAVQPRMTKEWDYLVGTDVVAMAGWGRFPATRWIGGDGDYFQDGKFRVDTTKGAVGRPGDEMAATVRFARSGLQAVRIYLSEGPMKVDAIWLSTTQKSRPDAAQLGPVKK